MKRAVWLAACAISIACVAVGCAPNRATVALGGETVRVYVADEPDERSVGLQGFDALEDGEGMLFVWSDAAVRTFAMKEVAFPIDVVFVDTSSHVSAIARLEPGSRDRVSGPSPSRYVLELPAGWARDHGIVVGAEFDAGDLGR